MSVTTKKLASLEHNRTECDPTLLFFFCLPSEGKCDPAKFFFLKGDPAKVDEGHGMEETKQCVVREWR